MSNLHFINVSSDYLRTTFQQTLTRFPLLRKYVIQVEQCALPNYTMRAQPVFRTIFRPRKARQYRVQISNHVQMQAYVRVEELPLPVLQGWFAHELGHIVDYTEKSTWGLLNFAIRYLTSDSYRRAAERRADLFAAAQGFGKDLLATKRYILDQSALPAAYKRRIQRYYLSPDELEDILQQRTDYLTDIVEY